MVVRMCRFWYAAWTIRCVVQAQFLCHMLYHNWKNEIKQFTEERKKERKNRNSRRKKEKRKEEVNIEKRKLKENIKNIKFHLKEYAEKEKKNVFYLKEK